DLPRAWRQRAADDLQERRLARAVAPDDAHDLAAAHVERDVVQGLEIPVIVARTQPQRPPEPGQDELPQSMARAFIALVRLRHAPDGDGDVVRAVGRRGRAGHDALRL